MKDFVPLGSGDSRYLKSVSNFKTLYPTFEAFSNALIEGTLPIDLNGVNPSGVAQMGTPLNKANLLADATETAIWGNEANRTVDAALRQVAAAANDAKSVVKLKDVTTSAAAAQVEFDLSDIDLNKYRELTFDMELLPQNKVNYAVRMFGYFNTTDGAAGLDVYSIKSVNITGNGEANYFVGKFSNTQTTLFPSYWTIRASVSEEQSNLPERMGRYSLAGDTYCTIRHQAGNPLVDTDVFRKFQAVVSALSKLILVVQNDGSLHQMIAAGSKLTVYGVLR